MPKGDGAVRRAAARETREDAVEEKKFKKKEAKKLLWGVNPVHVFFFVLFFLPTAFTMADYFFKFSAVPGGGYGTLDPKQAVWRTKIRACYEENNPSKVNEIPDLLRKYKGKERKLWKKLQKKYEPKEETYDLNEMNFD
jgi:hypothetical protein